MSTEEYYSSPRILRRMREGPLGGYIDLFTDRLQKEGQCRQSAWRSRRVARNVNHCLVPKNLGLGQLDERTGEQYQRPRS